MSDPFQSPSLTGRFFVPDEPLEAGASLLEQAQEQAWNHSKGAGNRRYCSYCSGETPHTDLLEGPEGSLAYEDEGAGLWRLWVREEIRTPGRQRTEEVADRLAIQRDPDTPLSRLHGRARKKLIDEARAKLLHKVTPTVRIVPIIVTPEWIWIARRAAATDHGVTHFLRNLLGPLTADPLVWAHDAPAWTSLSLAALMGFVESEGGELTPDLKVTEIETKGNPVVLKTSEKTEFVRGLIRQMLEVSAQVDLKRLGLAVFIDGSWVGVDIDAYGAWRIMPRPSAGGLPAERLKRRFCDAITAARRCGTVLKQVHDRIEEESA